MVIRCAWAVLPVMKPVPKATGLKGMIFPVEINTFGTAGSVMVLNPATASFMAEYAPIMLTFASLTKFGIGTENASFGSGNDSTDTALHQTVSLRND